MDCASVCIPEAHVGCLYLLCACVFGDSLYVLLDVLESSVNQLDLRLTDLPASAFQVLGLKTCMCDIFFLYAKHLDPI